MDPTYVANLHSLLGQSVAPDTNAIKAATAALNQTYYKDPNCIPALFEIVSTSSEQNVRHLATVELRKRVAQGDGKLWKEVSVPVRQAVKAKLLQDIVVEQARIVRHGMARVISAIAEFELETQSWPELLPFCHQIASSPNKEYRETGAFILYATTDAVMGSLKDNTADFFALLTQLMRDLESAEVRMTAVRALGSFCQYIEADEKAAIKSFQAQLPTMMLIIGQAAEANDEKEARDGFDVIETLLIMETPLLSKNIPDLIQFCLGIGANKNIDDEIRQMALNALNWTIKYKKSKIQSLNLAKPMMEVLLPIGAEADPEDTDEDSPSRLAFRAIDCLATVLPPTQVFPPLHSLVSGYMQSTDPGLRKSAMMAFGVTVEGCSEFIRPHMKTLWPLIDAGLLDPDPIVRKAACIAFACICEWLEEDCVERHAVLLPAIIGLTEDPATQGAACTALDAYLECLGDEISNYLQMIMQRLSALLATAPIAVKQSVIGAIGSAAHASKEKFAPYFPETMNIFQQFLALTTEGPELDVRGITMDAIGTFAEAVGKEAFAPYLQNIMNNALEGVALGNPRLKECTFLFFGGVASVFGKDFSPFVPTVMPLLLESLRQTETGTDDLLERLGDETAFSTGTLDSKEANDEMLAVDLAPGEAAPVADLDPKAVSVNSAIAIEKEIAADSMGTIAMAVGDHFLPFLEPCTLELIEALEHYYEGIRKSAVGALLQFIEVFYSLSDPVLWEPGANVPVPLHDKVKELVNHIMPHLMELWKTDDDRSVVSGLCSQLANTLAKVGPGLLEGNLRDVCEQVTDILEGKSLCQQDPDADEDDEPLEDQAEFESAFVSAALDVVASLGTVLGPDFANIFEQFLPLLAKTASKQKPNTVRATAIGTIGELVTSMRGSITPYTQQVLEITFAALSDEDPEIRSNAAYAVGVIIENSEQDISANNQYMHILNALRPVFGVTDSASQSELHGRDNAVGAVSRMILKNSGALPLDQVLPVLFGAMPLQNDFLENTPLYRAIFHLFRTHEALMTNYVDTLILPFSRVLAPGAEDELTEQVRAELVQLILHLKTTVPAKVAPLASVVPGL